MHKGGKYVIRLSMWQLELSPSVHGTDSRHHSRYFLEFLRQWSDMKCYIVHPFIHPFIHSIKTHGRMTYGRHMTTGCGDQI